MKASVGFSCARKQVLCGLAVVLAGLLLTGTASASITIETVPVGNPGNAGELSGAGAGGAGPDRVCGSVGYAYNIGKHEVTAGQYTTFLNAVAATDTYGLYNTRQAGRVSDQRHHAERQQRQLHLLRGRQLCKSTSKLREFLGRHAVRQLAPE